MPSNETTKMPSLNAHHRILHAQLRRCKEQGCTKSSTTLGAHYCQEHALGNHNAQRTLHEILNATHANGKADMKNAQDLDTARPSVDVLRNSRAAPDVALCKLQKLQHNAEITNTLKAAIRDAKQHKEGTSAGSRFGGDATAGSPSGEGHATGSLHGGGAYVVSPPGGGAAAGGPPRKGAAIGSLRGGGAYVGSPPEGDACAGSPLGEGATAGTLHGGGTSAGKGVATGNPPREDAPAGSPPGEGVSAGNPPEEGAAAGNPPGGGTAAGTLHGGVTYAGSPPGEGVVAGNPPGEGATAGSPPGEGASAGNPLEEGAVAGSLTHLHEDEARVHHALSSTANSGYMLAKSEFTGTLIDRRNLKKTKVNPGLLGRS